MLVYVVLKEVTEYKYYDDGNFYIVTRDIFSFKTKDNAIEFCNNMVKEAKEKIATYNNIKKAKIKVKKTRPTKNNNNWTLWSIFPIAPYDRTLEYDLNIIETKIQ